LPQLMHTGQGVCKSAFLMYFIDFLKMIYVVTSK